MCKMFIFRNIYRCNSTLFRSPYYSLYLVQIFNGSSTGGPSSSCEMIILRNNGHGGIIRVCMGIFTTTLRNKKNTSNSQKKYLTSLPQRITCYLTAYFDEKSPFERVVHFEVFNVHKKSPFLMYVENLEMNNSLKWALFIKVSGQITSNTLWKRGEVFFSRI